MATKTGFVKVQSFRIPTGKHLIPQFLFIDENVWRPCSLPASIVHRLDSNRTVTRFAFEAEMNRASWIQIDSSIHKLVRQYEDGSALYECDIEDAEMLRGCVTFEHKNFHLKLFHHTKAETVPLIFESGHLRASSLNYEGTRDFDNKNYVYFTDLPAINSQDDLFRIAMSDGGITLALEYDQPWYGVEMLNVPERERGGMDGKVEVYIDPALIEQQPMLYHDQRIRNEGQARYWELLHQNIFRIPVVAGGSISVDEQMQEVSIGQVNGHLASDLVLAGCAFQRGQIRIVFDEDEMTGLQVSRDAGGTHDPIERFLEEL
jgi:hypothetical protein